MRISLLPLVVVAALGAAACVVGTTQNTTTPGGPIVTPAGLQVAVSVSSVSLGDEGCTVGSAGSSSSGGSSGTSSGAGGAPPPPLEDEPSASSSGGGGAARPDALCDGAPRAGDAAEPGTSTSSSGAPNRCGCRGTSVQVSFLAGSTGNPSRAALSRVVLVDATTGIELQDLTPFTPTAWTGTSYVSWDGSIKANDNIKASYPLSSPGWSRFGDSYTKQYKLRVTVDVGGSKATIESQPVSREPAIAT